MRVSQTITTEKTQDPNPIPSNSIPQFPVLIEELEEDSEMITSEMGIEDMDLSNILEQEGMDLLHMVEKLKKKGIEHIPEEEVNKVNSLFLARQKAKMDMQKRSFGETKGLGVKSQALHQTTTNPKHWKKEAEGQTMRHSKSSVKCSLTWVR